MKRLALMYFLLVLFGTLSNAQHYYESPRNGNDVNLEITNLTTRSVYGWKTGFTLGASINNRMSIAYVNLIEIGGGETSGDSFRGASYQYYFNPKQNLNFGLGLMVGFYNEQFLAATPSLEVRYIYNKRWLLSMGYSRVDTYPKFDFKLGVRLFN